ncbi:hypothetical protein DERP_012325 [Dermatophagoides pteronyssinus]|uniref:Uncharacterized protein n=1 Tax=Dermatophagoides pteronyssinus TaxID=6956 RepID=A0ABQ8JQE9_DERPT|nr:hypothetical protein DERP_012325 [Dermatophagoides pteronyssinus]
MTKIEIFINKLIVHLDRLDMLLKTRLLLFLLFLFPVSELFLNQSIHASCQNIMLLYLVS